MPSSGDRLLAVLGLFTIARPEWTVEDAAAELDVSATTAYRYFKRLTRVGLISPVSGASYTLGPAIIQMDRQIQLCDPMLKAGRGVMRELISHVADTGVVLMCRLFHDRVMCVDQVIGRDPGEPVAFQRGRPMPLFLGAASKIILAHLPSRTLKTVYARNTADITKSGLAATWDEFRQAVAEIRRRGFAVSLGDLDSGRAAVAAPIFDQRKAILGSLTFVVPQGEFDEALKLRLAPLVVAGARAIERTMAEAVDTGQASRPRVRVGR